ncbi:MAG: CAP domain-containing protein [Myxococcales bacterium]|nr:CAP domain-containing protein [Myxococcales bacterium]
MKRAAAWLVFLSAAAVLFVVLGLRSGRIDPADVPEGLRVLLPGVPAPRPDPPPPGTPLMVELAEPPTDRYGASRPTSEDRTYAPLVEEAGGTYDPTLGQAARELAGFYATHRELAPSEPLAFLLDAAGATVWGVRQSVVVTNAEGLGVVEEAVSDAVRATPGPLQVGVGEVVLLDAPDRRVVAVLTARKGVQIDPMPRAFAAGERITIAGTLPPDHHDVSALALAPDGAFVEPPVEARGTRFSLTLVATPGPWSVEILANGPHGPTPLTQLALHVDEPVPDILSTHWPPAEAHIDDPAAEVARLVDNDRARFDLPPLRRDPVLDQVATRHSEDMARNGFVGHVSPRTGDVTARLNTARYRSATHAENVALNRSLWDAERGLMRSLGHRRNILSPAFDAAGYAAVRADDAWYVTQVFARPAPIIEDPEAARAALLERLEAARRSARVAPLALSRPLDEAARRAASAPDAKPKAALDAAARAGVTGRSSGWVVQLADLAQFEPPESLLEARYRRVGLGVRQFIGRPGPDIQVVVLVGE